MPPPLHLSQPMTLALVAAGLAAAPARPNQTASRSLDADTMVINLLVVSRLRHD